MLFGYAFERNGKNVEIKPFWKKMWGAFLLLSNIRTHTLLTTLQKGFKWDFFSFFACCQQQMQSKICKCLPAVLELMIYTHFKRSVQDWGVGFLRHYLGTHEGSFRLCPSPLFYLVWGNIVSSLKIAKKAKPLSRAHSESGKEPDSVCAPLDG